ncbi:MAG: PDDEXK nuclease domain-containing protein [Bacteroidota bacterium]
MKPSRSDSFIQEIKSLVHQVRARAVKQINAVQTQLYWQIGKRIKEEVLKSERAGYGEEILSTLASELTQLYGRGFSKRNLYRMLKMYECFSDEKIVPTLSSQLSWSHFVEILKIEDELKRNFYLQMAQNENWSVRQLRERVDSMLFERTAISRKPEKTLIQDLEKLKTDQEMSLDLALRDPYLLDFLGLKDSYSEKDLEQAILNELQSFILELGSDFAFLARQKRMQIGNEDYYLDLLFYHRKMQRLVAIELKLGSFKPHDKSQMELYLKWLAKHEQQKNEQPPLGLILCADKNEEVVELLEMDAQGIHVASYYTELPPKDVLIAKLQLAIRNAQQRQLPKSNEKSE